MGLALCRFRWPCAHPSRVAVTDSCTRYLSYETGGDRPRQPVGVAAVEGPTEFEGGVTPRAARDAADIRVAASTGSTRTSTVTIGGRQLLLDSHVRRGKNQGQRRAFEKVTIAEGQHPPTAESHPRSPKPRHGVDQNDGRRLGFELDPTKVQAHVDRWCTENAIL